MSDEQVYTVVAVVGLVIASAIAALIWGGKAVDVVLTVAVGWLIWDRVSLFDRVDQAVDDADQAVRGVESVTHHVAGTEPAGTGRHAAGASPRAAS